MSRAAKRIYPGPEKAPFRNGNLEEYAGYGFGDGETWGNHADEWRENVPFEATLTLTGIERGRSAMRFMWDDGAGNTYPMFAIDMCALALSREGVKGAVASGKWIVMKRGANYGIARYEA